MLKFLVVFLNYIASCFSSSFFSALLLFSFFLFKPASLNAETFVLEGLGFECASCKRVNIEGLEFKGAQKFSKEFCYHELGGEGKIVSCVELSNELLDLSLKSKKVFNSEALISFLEVRIGLNLNSPARELDSLLELIFLSSGGEKALLESINNLSSKHKKILNSRISSKEFSSKLKILWQKELEESVLENFDDRFLLACSSKEMSFINLFSSKKAYLPKEILEQIKKLSRGGFPKNLTNNCKRLISDSQKAFKFLEPCSLKEKFKSCDVLKIKEIFTEVDFSSQEISWLENIQQALALETSKVLAEEDRILLLSQINYKKWRTPMFHEILEKSLQELSSKSEKIKFNKRISEMLQFVSKEDEIIKNLYSIFLPKDKSKPISKGLVFIFCGIVFFLTIILKLKRKRSSFKRDENFSCLKDKEKFELLNYFEAKSSISKQDLNKNFKNKAKILHPDNSLTGNLDEFNLLSERHVKLKKILYG